MLQSPCQLNVPMFEGLAIPPPQKPLLSHVKDLDVTPMTTGFDGFDGFRTASGRLQDPYDGFMGVKSAQYLLPAVTSSRLL